MYKKLFFFLFIAWMGNATAQSKKEMEVAASVNALTKAMIDADKEGLKKYTHEHLSYGHSSGVVQTREEFIDGIVSGRSDFVTIDLSAQTITVIKKSAFVRHIFSATTNDGGKPGTVKLSILLVWLKKDNTWKLVARQAVKVT